MQRNTRDVLERPFPAELVRTRKGAFGRQLSYVETRHFIARLNEAHGGDWDFEIVEHRIFEEEVLVLGRLSAGGAVKVAFGGSSITRAKETGETLSVADDLKAAASDALKKCSSLLGLGLHLYDDRGENAVAQDEAGGTAASRSTTRPGGNGSGPQGSVNRGNGGKLTSRQFQAILSLAERKALSEPALKSRVLDAFGVPLEQLDRRQASQLITELSNGRNSGNGRGAAGAS